ncbi:putative Lactosylceramide 4-alpha-galactosyltransferase [Operophtera brumata]|uniref:Putative Lactosylceramide 4-alpha-galactosyltransferase n=1 Tax=Operophtera brumata TaxID=104452 RepID=A0A0L7L1X8_OPEBR|nr:putative Lactosylceramide 4-alpha-galactosyltransferase [Operophtera brumata]
MYTKVIYKENISRKVKRHKVILTFIVVTASFLLVLSTDLSPDLYFINFGTVEDVSCHYAVTGDALEPIDTHFAPASNSIFFHETSCRGGLNSRQACSIESAARAHPGRTIYVLFSAPINKISLEDIIMELLKKFSNIKFRRVHLVEYAKGTPLELLVEGGALNRTRWPISHTSDVLRFLTLYKWGGVYLDLDTVVAKSLDGLPKNWAARENDASELFYPVGADHPEEFFEPAELPGQDAYIYHIWNRQTKHLKVERNSPYAKLAKRHCPVVYETFREFFGS